MSCSLFTLIGREVGERSDGRVDAHVSEKRSDIKVRQNRTTF